MQFFTSSSQIRRRILTLVLLTSVFVDVMAYAATPAVDTDPLFITQSVSIARKLRINPANDLVEPGSGKILDSDDVFGLMKAGKDVSLYEPASLDILGGDLSSRDIQYPPEGSDGYVNLTFDSPVTTPRGLYRARVLTDNPSAEPFRLSVSWNTHSALMNAELLKQLGYTIDLPKRYAKARIKFTDVASRDTFLKDLAGGTRTAIEQWLISTPAADALVVELRDVALEPARIATPPYYWGMISANELQNRRAVRALLVPIVLTTIPESINLWTFEVAKLVNERVILYHPFAGNFQGQLNFQDAQWISRKMCAINETGLHKIIRAGGYPESIEPLLYEKLKSRRNNLMELFQVKCAPLAFKADIDVTDPETGAPLIKNGKLLRKEFPGYGLKFIGDDPDDPLRRDEMFRYLKIRGLGTALSAGLDELNSKLLKYDQTDAQNYKDERWAFQSGPREKIGLSATRKLVSGTYYGSESQVQLVDQVSLSATLGYYGGMKFRAIPNDDFKIEPNATLSRTYLHVKPMDSIKDAAKVPWKDLPVIPKMRALAKLIDAGTTDDEDAALNKFLDEFLPGENFAVVDSFDLGTKVTASFPMPLFLAVPDYGKLSFSAGYDHVVLRRTMIQRQADGTLQIALQHVKNKTLEYTATYNFLMDVVSASISNQGSDSDSSVFVIDPNLIVDKKNLNEGLIDLLVNNDSTSIEKNFKAYALHHDLKAKTKQIKILPWIAAKYHEEHGMTAYAPGAPHDDEHKRELYSLRDRKLGGSDWLGFGLRALGSIIKEFLLPDINSDLAAEDARLDPSGSFLGSSHWQEVQLESELTPTRNARTLMTMQETYTGWKVSKDKMLKILRKLEAKAHETSPTSPSLIHVEEFLSTTRLELYQITSSLRVSGAGMDVLVDLAKSAPDASNFLATLVFQHRIEPNEAGEESKWGKKFYELLRKVPAPSSSFIDNRERIKLMYKVDQELSSIANAKQILKLVGPEFSIFQISVTGFRKNDETGDSAYLSASMGQTDDKVNDGAFASFEREQNISAYEVRATYLGNGL